MDFSHTKMKVLWFEVTEPSFYTKQNCLIAGWQDSLEEIVSSTDDIDLTIAFESCSQTAITRNNVKYVPININLNAIEKKQSFFSPDLNNQKLVSKALDIIQQVKPDIIHIFGTEWPFGLIAEKITTPIVIHIQGSIVQYNEALYPPGYSLFHELRLSTFHPLEFFYKFSNYHREKKRKDMEIKIWKAVPNYMGRTEWDKNLSNLMHPGRNYFHVDEAIRKDFTSCKKCWSISKNKKLILVSTGCSTFWKGPDMLLKTAKILKGSKIDFEWNVIGLMPKYLMKMVEKKEKTTFLENNVNFLGRLAAPQIVENLQKSSIFVHTAYVENSPNAICEAQLIGIPVVSTNVGGISSLITHNENGYLVPANDPYQMASFILKLHENQEIQLSFSKKARQKALMRHDPKLIREQLLNCYKSIINCQTTTVHS